MKSIRISSHTQRHFSHLPSWWKSLTNCILHSYSGHAIALPGDKPAFVLSNLLLYGKNFFIFLKKSLLPLKKTPWKTWVLLSTEKTYQKKYQAPGGILALALLGCSSIRSEVGWEMQLFCAHPAPCALNPKGLQCGHNCTFTQSKLERQGSKVIRRELSLAEVCWRSSGGRELHIPLS